MNFLAGLFKGYFRTSQRAAARALSAAFGA